MDIISAQFGPLGGPFMASTEEQTTGLVVLLHGYGANGLDLFGLAEPLRAALQTSGLAVLVPQCARNFAWGRPIYGPRSVSMVSDHQP